MQKGKGKRPGERTTKPKVKEKYAKIKNRRNEKSETKRPNRAKPTNLPKFDGTTRLNKYIANAGLCSRREADAMIASGVVSVNGKIVSEMGYKVLPTDVVKFDGVTIKSEQKRYVLLNKPVDFSLKEETDITKPSAYQLVGKASKEFLYPVGKMDKAHCGLILFTNDSDLIKKLTHVSYDLSQLYHLVLDKEMEEDDLKKLTSGMFVDNKMFNAKEASFVEGRPHNEIGVKLITSSHNMIKYMIGKLGYKITKLDRVEYAGLTKWDLPRGHFRHLTEKEVAFLMMS